MHAFDVTATSAPAGYASARLTPAAIAAAASPVAAPVVLMELDFASGFFRAWTGIGPLHWAGKVFEGLGAIGAVSEIEETVELRAVQLTLSLSPVPQEVARGAAGGLRGCVAR